MRKAQSVGRLNMHTEHNGARRVRTRVAPSPTGDPHVGTAYVALANYAFAKRHGGDFILRIEDTDRTRSTPESERAILEALRWTGLSWDEGPDIGGPHGPYRQSERSAIYAAHVAELLGKEHAFRCFCTPERLDIMREAQKAANQPPKYDGLCLSVTPAESAARAAAGELFVVRMKVPAHGVCIVRDMHRGPIEIAWETVDMQVLMKSDGFPTYHLANVVDDHLMQITHVIRGEEWTSSAPKHLLLYEYFGWQAPQLMHLPLLRNPDKSKLSKRKNPTGILFYRAMGYLPEALLNFLGLFMTTSTAESGEVFTLEDFVASRFGLDHIALGGPVFDVPKLDWLNAQYLHAMTSADLGKRVAAWAFTPERVETMLGLAVKRVERLTDLAPLLAFLFAGRVTVDAAALTSPKVDAETARKALWLAMTQLEGAATYDWAAIDAALKNSATLLGVKFKDLARTFYVAMTGSPTSVPLFDAMALLGRDICRERFRVALDALGPVTAKEQKEWQKLFAPPVPQPV
jgi:glutamyl-tRNA synthetase